MERKVPKRLAEAKALAAKAEKKKKKDKKKDKPTVEAKPLQKSTMVKTLASEREGIEFINTGSQLLNCVVSGHVNGGWALGRMVNCIGDQSTGKTLIAIEACANFLYQWESGRIRYCETEAAFDQDYAERLGLPVDRVEFPNEEIVKEPETKYKGTRREVDSDSDYAVETDASLKAKKKRKGKSVLIESIEDMGGDLDAFLDERIKAKEPGLYIVDSYDFLTSDAELQRDLNDGTFGAEKAKKSSEIFRRLSRKLRKAQTCLMIISQTRDDMTATYGRKKRRAGGKALDFAASQIVWLTEVGKTYKTRKGEKRTSGIITKVKSDKNKIAPPHRECEIPITFSYGIEDIQASLEWLKAHNKDAMKQFAGGVNVIPALTRYNDMSVHGQRRYRRDLGRILQKAWEEHEALFLPTRKGKYADM